VSLTANLFHAASTFITTVPVAEVAHGVFNVVAVGGMLVFFRPLLTGIGRALVLTVRPRRARTVLRPQQDASTAL
jgi:hypothetical protein